MKTDYLYWVDSNEVIQEIEFESSASVNSFIRRIYRPDLNFWVYADEGDNPFLLNKNWNWYYLDHNFTDGTNIRWKHASSDRVPKELQALQLLKD